MPQTSPFHDKLSLTLHIGVTGHRPNRLEHAQPDLLTAQINHVLQKVDATLTNGCSLNLKQPQQKERQKDLFFAKTVSIFEPLK